MKIIIDPRIKYNYSSWYILGLRHLFTPRSIKFDIVPFLQLPFKSIKDLNAGMPFIIKDKDTSKKIFIDFEDNKVISKERYEWCDIYGKINAEIHIQNQFEKLLPIGPSCGLQIDAKWKVGFIALYHYCMSKKYSSIPLKLVLRDYLYTIVRRKPLSTYEEKIEVKDNYVFHASTLWYSVGTMASTNIYRGAFIRACQKAGTTFEGGFFYVEGQDVIDEAPDYPKYKEEFKDIIYTQRLSLDDYIQKTKESFVVFNTPSVCECHGWKLAEYLCMGKAIISMPLTREMPGEGLVHGENVHFVNSPEEIYDAVLQIKNDSAYRERLEKGARSYYEKWLAPEVVIKRLMS